MDVAVQILFNLIWGAACAAIANSKGRSPVGWFFAGFFLTCIGLIIILCLSDEKAAERRREKDRGERRRLREQLRQERMKSEAYRRHVSARLDTHDEHLGIDTRQQTALPEGHGFQGQQQMLGEGPGGEQPFVAAVHDPGSHDPGSHEPGDPHAGGSTTGDSTFGGATVGSQGASFTAPTAEPTGSLVKEWFYELGGESRGPVSEAAIRQGLRNAKIDGTTLVWREGMPNWQAVSEVPAFAGEFGR